MLIAITSEGSEPSSLVANIFGKAPFIIIYDHGKNKFESFHNPYSKLLGGAGIQISQLIIEKNVEALITCDVGLNTFRLLQSADIKVFLCQKKPVIEIVKDYFENKLHEYKQQDEIPSD